MNAITSLWRRAQRLYLFLLPLRFSFLSLIVVAFAFLISAQGYDIIAHIAEDDPTGARSPHTWQRIGYIIGVVFLALEVWYCSRQLLHVLPAENAPRASEYPRLTLWLPRVLGALAFVISIASLWRVARNYDVPQPVQALTRMAIILGLLMIAFIAFTIVRRRYMKVAAATTLEREDFTRLTKFLLRADLVLAVALFVWSTFYVQSTIRIGSATLVLLAFALLVPVGSLLVWFGMRHRVPVLMLLLVWAVLISPLADNHVIRTVSGSVDHRLPVATAFDRWFERLQTQHPATNAAGRIPVLLVATEGGGIRAAYWTGAVLTSLTDTIPQFADHLFAISAVSGGALGSTVYEGLLVRRGEAAMRLDELHYTPQIGEHRSMRFAASQVLSQDALAPTLAAMMQPDLVQRFIPAPIFPDRARALEMGWERAWRNAVARPNGDPDDLFAGGFLAMMRGREATLPSLFLNGTVVETGQRIIASNTRVNSSQGAALGRAIDLFDAIGTDVHVSTAVDNSTRFTYVGPAATLIRSKNGNGGSPLTCDPGARCEHVVDGGYFENSGSATINDILRLMSQSKYASRIEPHVIFINFFMAQPAPVDSVQMATEVLSPVRALLAVRGAHASLAETELQRKMGPNGFTVFRLVQTNVVFPLGWLLADRTRNLMDAQMGPRSKENGANVYRIATLLGQQNAVRRDLVQELAVSREADPKFQ